jgi:hypothetical protein
MKAFRSTSLAHPKACLDTAWVGSLGLLLGSFSALGCSLETTGSGGISLSPDDDVAGDDSPDTIDDEPPDDDDGPDDDVDGGPSNGGKDAQGEDDDDDGDDPVRNDNCRPGNYQGSYVCKQPVVTTPPWAVGFTGSQIDGTFTFRLTPATKADAFELTGGTLHNEQLAFFKLDATIMATLTCGRPLKGKLTNASYTNLLGTPTSFDSPFDATFDETTGDFTDGTFRVSDANGTLCEGTWTATRAD